LTPYFEDLFKALFINAYRTDSDSSVDLALASFTALSALTEYSCLDSSSNIYEMLIPVLQ
jgi:hypothetical protein